MSAFVSFFLLPFTFFSFLLRLLCTMLFMWELLWKLTLLISGFLMSTVAIGNVGPFGGSRLFSVFFCRLQRRSLRATRNRFASSSLAKFRPIWQESPGNVIK